MANTDKKLLQQQTAGDTVLPVNNTGTNGAAAANPVTGNAGAQAVQQAGQSGSAQIKTQQGINDSANALISMPGVSDATKQALGGLVTNGYQPSQNVSAALNELNGIIARQPGAFQNQYSTQLNNLLNQILNREAFSYDAASDPMYRMYREMYTQQGKQAMEDTIGRASQLTGGYGSSYATTAAQQAYQGSLQQLNQIIPQLYAQARQAYADEGDMLMSQYGALGDAYNRDFSEYQAAYDRWAADRAFAQNRYEGERNFDYGSYADQLNFWSGMADRENNQYNTDREFQAQQDALRQEQENWQAQFDYGKAQDALAQENWLKEFQAQQDAIAQDQANWQAQFDYGVQQDQLAQENWLKEFQAQQDAIAQDQANWQTQYDYGVQQDQLAQENWLKEYQMQQDAMAQDKAARDQEYALELALAMAEAGKTPSAELLMQAGFSQADIDAILKGKSSGSGSSSSGSGKKSSGTEGSSAASSTGNVASDKLQAQGTPNYTGANEELLEELKKKYSGKISTGTPYASIFTAVSGR